MIRLLLVEDDANLSYIIQSSMVDIIGGYEVKIATNGEEGLKLWKEYKPDVIITDIDMPEMDGHKMVEKIREVDGDTLIFFASGLITPKDVIRGYSLGANDYVKKPYVPEELHVRIEALLKIRSGIKSKNMSKSYALGSLSFDLLTGALKGADGNYIHLPLKELQVLRCLILSKGEMITRDAIIEAAWNVEKDYYVSRNLDVIISALRKKLAQDPSVQIKTVRSTGFILEG